MTDVFSLEEQELAQWLCRHFFDGDGTENQWSHMARDLLEKQKKEIEAHLKSERASLSIIVENEARKYWGILSPITSFDAINRKIYKKKYKDKDFDGKFEEFIIWQMSESIKSHFFTCDVQPGAFVATESDNKESLVATTDSSASVAIPKPLKEEDLNYIVGYLTTKDVRLAVEWIVNKIEETNGGKKPVKEWKEYAKSDSNDYYEAWLVKKAFGEVLK